MVRQLKETGIKGTVSRGLWAKFVFYIYITVFCKKKFINEMRRNELK